MKTFLQPLQSLAEIEEIEKQAKKNHGILEISGCIESQKAHQQKIFTRITAFMISVFIIIRQRICSSFRQIFTETF